MYAFTINLRELLNPYQHIDWSGKKKNRFWGLSRVQYKNKLSNGQHQCYHLLNNSQCIYSTFVRNKEN